MDAECIIMSDFSLDYKHIDSDSQLHVCLKHYMNMLDLSQAMCQPTRITSTIATVLHLIVVSDHAKMSNSGVAECGIGDQLMINYTHNCKRTFINEHNPVFYFDHSKTTPR